MLDEPRNVNRRDYMCEFDVEDRSSRQDEKPAPYVCAMCGAEGESLNNLCAPEFNRTGTEEPPHWPAQ